MLLISSIQKMVPNMFLFINLCELTERSDLRGVDVPALGSGGAAAPAVR